MPKPDEDLAVFLAARGLGIYNATGANIFVGIVRSPSQYVPAKAMFLLLTGGPAAERIFGGTYILPHASVQIRVRGNANEYQLARDWARQILTTVHGARITGYLDVVCQQSEPVWLGYDSNNLPEWSINVQMDYQE